MKGFQVAMASSLKLAAQLSGEKIEIRSWLALPIFSLCPALVSVIFSIVFRIEAGLLASNEKPLKEFTRSGSQPHWIETATGKPADMASFTTRPHGSKILGRMKKEALE